MDLFLTITTAVGPVLVVVGLLLTVRHFKLARTVSYIERFNNPSMVSTRAHVDAWLASGDDDAARLAALEKEPLLHTEIMTFMNLFFEVGIAYRYRLLNRRVTFEIWDVLIPEYWRRLAFYIEHNRAQGRNIGGAFEALAEEIIAARAGAGAAGAGGPS